MKHQKPLLTRSLDAEIRLELAGCTDSRSDANHTGSGELNLTGRERHRVSGVWNRDLQDMSSVIEERLLLHDVG